MFRYIRKYIRFFPISILSSFSGMFQKIYVVSLPTAPTLLLTFSFSFDAL